MKKETEVRGEHSQVRAGPVGSWRRAWGLEGEGEKGSGIRFSLRQSQKSALRGWGQWEWVGHPRTASAETMLSGGTSAAEGQSNTRKAWAWQGSPGTRKAWGCWGSKAGTRTVMASWLDLTRGQQKGPSAVVAHSECSDNASGMGCDKVEWNGIQSPGGKRLG